MSDNDTDEHEHDETATTFSYAGSYSSPACEWANVIDRRYFAAHPGETTRLRLPISGEFPPGTAEGCEYVLVWRISDTVRVRQPWCRLTPEDVLGGDGW
ncbi:MAG: hypothetical protein ACXWQ5_18325 [Ktedonobacterales bacterium]